ncbi:MAG: tetratricopeptide repeat protein, partial [Bryobacteraceae bacterium]|nr:tetratricopeptide repeat protein [Bryobacteraceae bacterium]
MSLATAHLTRHRARLARAGAAALLICLALGCKGPAARDPAGFYRSALAEHRRGEYQSALEKSRAGAAQFTARENPAWHWRFRLLEAETLISTGAAAEASRLLDGALAGAAPDRALEARRLLNLGWVRSLQTSHEEGLALLEKARVLAEESGGGEVLAQVEIRRGTVLTYLKRQEEAERSFQLSLSLARGLQDPYLEGSALGNLGFLRLNKGSYEEAIYYFEQVLPLARRIRAPALEALTAGNLGWCYFRLGDLDKAAQRFEHSQSMLAGLGKLLEHQVHLGNLGSVWLIRGDYRKAIGYYERALAAARRLNHQRSAGDWLSNLATAHIELGEIETAARLNREAREVRAATGGKLPDAWLEVNEGRILEARGDADGAAKRYLAVAESLEAGPTARFDAKS